MDKDLEVSKASLFSIKYVIIGAIVLCIVVIVYAYVRSLHTPPTAFPTRQPITIEEGSHLAEIATQLKNQNLIRSKALFQLAIKQSAGEYVKAETYYFETPLDVTLLAEALTEGRYTLPPERVVIPEGLRIDQIDELVSNQFENIDRGDFNDAARGLEGYLFPDTYYATQSLTAENLVTLMNKNFVEKMETIADDLTASSRSLEEVIIMASLIEREASTLESKHIVAGILWERIAINMPLQVDAAFEYIYKKSAVDLGSEDLLIDSPYNTYKNRGLPPTPIVNPGLESILAALNPTPSPYLYYITAPNGTFYYAETFEEHKQNIADYLR